jgi:hypothetical protein
MVEYDRFKHLYDIGPGVSPGSARLSYARSDRPSYGRSIERPYEFLILRRNAMVSHDVRRIEPPLRLTRRGRTVVLVVLVLAALAASAVLFSTASRAESQPGPAPTIVVQPGDTLWEIAARTVPSRDNQAAVAELRDLNKLPGYDIHPGDVLVLPRDH